MKYTALIVLILGAQVIRACECPEIQYSGKYVRHFFNSYDKVFVGNLLESKNDGYKFEVIRGFKNCQFRDILWGRYNNSCSVVPYERGLWIVYASIQDSTTNEIDIDACNSTRNLNSSQQYLYDGYDVNAPLYELKQEQSFKIVELSILSELNIQERIDEKESRTEINRSDQIEELKSFREKNRISLFAILFSIIAILMNLNTQRTVSR